MDKKQFLETVIAQCDEAIPLVTETSFLCHLTDGWSVWDHCTVNAPELSRVIKNCCEQIQSTTWCDPEVPESLQEYGRKGFKVVRINLLRDIRKQAKQLLKKI